MKKPVFWRRWLITWAFSLNHHSWYSKLFWRLSRFAASEDTHALLAAHSAGLYMNAIMRGEM